MAHQPSGKTQIGQIRSLRPETGSSDTADKVERRPMEQGRVVPSWLIGPGMLAIVAIVMAAAVAVASYYLMQATTLTIAIAPRDGTEPDLLKAYAAALEEGRENIRLKPIFLDDVRESAAALEDGRADLAVVRPDVSLPVNALTLANLRDQAMLVMSPESTGIASFPKLGGKRLGIAAHRDADLSILKAILGYYGLRLDTDPAGRAVAKDGVQLVRVDDADVARAIRDRRIDAFVHIIAPAAPKALAMVEAIKGASRNGKVVFADVPDGDAIIERFPMLQSVTVAAGLFGGAPKLPAEDVKSVGSSYRLMARSSVSRTTAADVTQHFFEMRTAMSRSTEAANYIVAPTYDTTAAATSARIPIHPGAIDYFEREQHGFLDRYGDSLYMLGVLVGGLASAFAWLRQRLASLRRESIDDVIDRALEITRLATTDRASVNVSALRREIDQLATDVVIYARQRAPDMNTIKTAEIALATARSALAS